MLSCYGCIHRNTSKCYICVGWNKFESNTIVNPALAMNIDREMKMLAKAALNNVFGTKNAERENDMRIKKVYFNNPVTVVLWEDGTKTIVKAGEGDIYDPEKGLAMAIAKKALGNQGNYYEIFKKWLPEDPVAKHERELKKIKDEVKKIKKEFESIPAPVAEDSVVKREVILTPEELAEKIGVTKETIQKQCRQGQHSGAVKVGGKWKIPYEE